MGKRAERWLARFFASASVVWLVAILCEASAWAQNAKANTSLAIVLEGAPASLRGGIGNELPSPWTQTDASVVSAGVKKRQLSRSLKALESPATKDQYTSKLANVAADIGARAAVSVVIIANKKERKGHVVLVSDTGDVVVDTYVALAAPADDGPTLAKAFTDKLDVVLHPETAAPKPEPAAAATPGEPIEAPKPDATASTTAATPGKDAPPASAPTTPIGEELPPLVVATLAFEVANRHLDFRGFVKGTPIDYDSGLVMTPALAVDFFPGAKTGTKVLEDIGLEGDFAMGLASNASWTRFDAGLEYRIWFRREWNAPMIAPSVGYGQESYSSSNAGDKRPAVGYKMLRPRVDLRVPVWRIAILAGGAFLVPLDSGDLASKFSDASVLGWEANIGVTFPITKVLEVGAGFGYRRMIYWFSPKDADPNFARGAHDQTYRPEIGVTAHL